MTNDTTKQLLVIEQNAAGVHMMQARRVDEVLLFATPLERKRHAEAWRALSAELAAAAAKAERYVPEDDVPEYLRAGSAVALRGGR